MTNYRIFNVTVDSDITLPELPESGQACSIKVRQTACIDHANVSWLHDWRDQEDEVEISLGKAGQDFVLNFPELADFRIAGNLVEYAPQKDLPDNTLRHLLLDQVLPRLIGHQGHLVLHASGVVLSKEGAVLFVGESGIGKSTLASAFEKSGATQLADDCVLVDLRENVTLNASYPGLRLYPDSLEATNQAQGQLVNHYSEKRRSTSEGEIEQAPLGTIFLLSQSEEINVAPSRSADDLAKLINQCFLLDVTDLEVHRRQFRDLQALLESCREYSFPTYDGHWPNCVYPHRKSKLDIFTE